MASSLSSSAIVKAFERWLRFGEETPEAKGTSYVVLAAKSTRGMLAHDVGDSKSFPRGLRERGLFVQVTPWWIVGCAEDMARSWAGEMLETVKEHKMDGVAGADGWQEGVDVSAFAANLSKGIDLRTVWAADMLLQIQWLKQIWDPDGVF